MYIKCFFWFGSLENLFYQTFEHSVLFSDVRSFPLAVSSFVFDQSIPLQIQKIAS